MRYPLDELLDKKSIIQLKIERIDEENEKGRLKEEFSDYHNAIEEYIREGICSCNQVNNWYKELYKANSRTWDLESNIRKGQLGNLEDIYTLAEIGRTAIKIRESNGIRVGIKGEIVKTSKSGYIDIKINHASEDILKNYKSKP